MKKTNGVTRPINCPSDQCHGQMYARRRRGAVVTFQCGHCGKQIDKDYS